MYGNSIQLFLSKVLCLSLMLDSHYLINPNVSLRGNVFVRFCLETITFFVRE